MTEEIKQRVKEFLAKHQLCVMATADESKGQPEAAVIGFAEQNDLSLIVGTSSQTRKYKNLKSNKQVALVIGWDSQGTLQYEGEVEELPAEDSPKYVEIMGEKNPFSRRFGEDPNQRYFKVTPTWIRLTDHTKSPDGVEEISF